MEFSIRLKELREAQGLSQAELAKAIGVGVSTIGMWESTKRLPGAKTLNKLLDFFDVSLDYLLGRTDELGAVVMPGSELTPEERELLRDFRGLSRPLKDMLRSIIRTWQGEDRIPAKKPNGSSTGAG